MIKTVIIDDEEKARESIRNMLKTYCPEVSVIATAGSVKEGVEVLRTHKPDLLLLDIKMGDGTGFDLLKKIRNNNFFLIFITAFEEFAIRAIKFSALDYILKPIDPDELINAVEKVGARIEKENIGLRLKALYENLDALQNHSKKIVLKAADSVHVMPVSDIVRCESEKNTTHFFTGGGDMITVPKSLKEYSELLQEYNFLRVHQSHLVNLLHVRRYEKAGSGSLVMVDGSRVPVSFRKKEELMKLFKSL